MDQVPLHLIVVAAGNSRRYGGGDKLLADLNGAPVFVHALRRLTPAVTGKCVLVVPQGKSRIFQEAAFPFVRDLKLFDLELWEKAQKQFPDADLTDDAGLLRMAGFPVALLINPEPNIKLTTPSDLTVLRALI